MKFKPSLIVLCLSCLVVAACGKKGDPVAPAFHSLATPQNTALLHLDK